MNKQQTTDNIQRNSPMVFRRFTAHVLWLIAIIFIISSCSTKREMSGIKMMSANNIIKEVDENRFEFDNLEATMGISMKGDNIPGLKGQLRMQNDSVIWISLSLKIGIEVARVMITDDTIKFVNRNTRTYIDESLEIIKNALPVEASLQFFQDLLVGNLSNINDDDRYKVTIEDGRYRLGNDSTELISNNIWVTPNSFKISRYNIKENYGNNVIELRYGDFQEVGGKLMPSKINLELSFGEKMSLEINYSDIKSGEKLNFPFNISKKYDKTYLW